MLKLFEIYKHYGVDYMYDSELTSVEYYRLKKDGDIQIWDTYDENKKPMYEVCCLKHNRSRTYYKLADAMMAGVAWYLYQGSNLNATR